MSIYVRESPIAHLRHFLPSPHIHSPDFAVGSPTIAHPSRMVLKTPSSRSANPIRGHGDGGTKGGKRMGKERRGREKRSTGEGPFRFLFAVTPNRRSRLERRAEGAKVESDKWTGFNLRPINILVLHSRSLSCPCVCLFVVLPPTVFCFFSRICYLCRARGNISPTMGLASRIFLLFYNP